MTTSANNLSLLDPGVARIALQRLRYSRAAPTLPGQASLSWPETEQQYRRFLSLKQWYPNQLLVPVGTALQLWQAHILDTRAYRSDCEAVFGRFIDHFPYLGAESEADQRELHVAEQLYRDLYARHFGAPSGALEIAS